MKKIAQGIVRLRKLILTVAVLLLIPSALGAVATRINYDILTYLPPELDSMVGEIALAARERIVKDFSVEAYVAYFDKLFTSLK